MGTKQIVGAHHSQGAIRAAEAITGGVYGDDKRYKTAYGHKTVMGIADMIETQTACAVIPQLLEALEMALGTIERIKPPRDYDSTWGTRSVIMKAIEAAQV